MRRIRGRRTDYEQVEYIPPNYSVELKGTVSVMLSDPPCKDDDSRVYKHGRYNRFSGLNSV